MEKERIYLDYAATTPLDPQVLAAMLPCFGRVFGNPASLHAFGQEAGMAVEAARNKLAALLGAAPAEIVFTSGGTESDNFALKGVAYGNREKGDHLIVSAVEHHAVLESARFLEKEGFRITLLPVDGTGRVDPEDVRRAITEKTILISVMHANNEIGTLQPVAAIGAIARERGICFHTDAVQTFGHLPFTAADLNADLVSASAHKLYGPKGVGLLYIRKGTRLAPFLHGGEQEGRRRASTLNVPGIVGFAKAAELAAAELPGELERLTVLRDRFQRGVLERLAGVRLNGHPAERLPGHIHFSLSGIEAEGVLLGLDMQGIACATGSACSSTSMEASHVLSAIGLPREFLRGSLRFTLGRQTTEEEVDAALAALVQVVGRLRPRASR
ncbi:MAG: cysteine desulfurase family protein [Deltaproteobacteria bacterium]|nr:cysteine desulfurase family protein [Deltaproteobacteria bacterium]